MSGNDDRGTYEGFFRDRRSRSNFWWMFVLYLFLAASIVVPIWGAGDRNNRSEKIMGTPSMNNEQYGREDHHEERQVTVLIAPIHKNENNSKNNNSTENGEDQATCVPFDDVIQIRVSSSNVYQSCISGTVKRKN